MAVNSVGLTSPQGTLNVSVPAGGQNPVTSAGLLAVDLPVQTGLRQVAGQVVTNPVITVDKVGRVTSLASAGPSAGVTSVGLVVNENVFVASAAPVTGSGNLSLDMVQVQGLEPGTYYNPALTVDVHGRVMAISSQSQQGFLASFSVDSPESTLQVTGSPVTALDPVLSLDLAPSGAAPGTYTNPVLTVNAQGIVTSVQEAAVSPVTSFSVNSPENTLQVTGSPVTALNPVLDLDLVSSGATPGTYTNPVLTVNAQGIVTSVQEASVAPVTSFSVQSPLGSLSVPETPVTASSSVLTLDLAASGVIPGTYTNPVLTVNAQGIVQSIQSTSGWGILLARQITFAAGQSSFMLSVPGLTANCYGWAQTVGGSSGGLMPQVVLDGSPETGTMMVYLTGQTAIQNQNLQTVVNIMIAGPDVVNPGFFVESLFWGNLTVMSGSTQTFTSVPFFPSGLKNTDLVFMGVVNGGVAPSDHWYCVQPFWTSSGGFGGLNVNAVNVESGVQQTACIFGVVISAGTVPEWTIASPGPGGVVFALQDLAGTGYSTFQIPQKIMNVGNTLMLGVPYGAYSLPESYAPVVPSLGYAGQTGGVVPSSLCTGATYGFLDTSLYSIAGAGSLTIPSGQDYMVYEAPWITPATLFLVQANGSGASQIGLAYPGNIQNGSVTFYAGQTVWSNRSTPFSFVAFNPVSSFMNPVPYVMTQVFSTSLSASETSTTLPEEVPLGSFVFLLPTGSIICDSSVISVIGKTVNYWCWTDSNTSFNCTVLVVTPSAVAAAPYTSYCAGIFLPSGQNTTVSTTLPSAWTQAAKWGYGCYTVVSLPPTSNNTPNLDQSVVEMALSSTTATVTFPVYNQAVYPGIAGASLFYFPAPGIN